MPNSRSAFNYSLDVSSADAVVFIFEFTTRLEYGEKLGLLQLVGKVPRRRRVVIDCDGKYNAAISVVGDTNHPDAAASLHWVETCDSLSDKIFQPTFHPLRPNVRPFFFHAYNPAWEVPLDFNAKEYGMVYVGNNWFRWLAMKRVLRAIEPVREQVGRIGLLGQGWESVTPWGGPALIEDAYYTDPIYLQKMNVEIMPAVRFDRVIPMMGRGMFSPVIYRPLFDYLRLVTCRTYETPAANTIPLFGQDANYVSEIYGEAAIELVLPEQAPEEKVVHLLSNPEYYAKIILGIRRHLAEKHSYAVRLKELIGIVES
jgi:hypothetical protein